jgi:membrane protease YdiL (CAAX protease family)
MPDRLDFAFFALLVLLGLHEHFVHWPRLRAALAAKIPGARLRGYLFVLVEEWVLCGVVAVLWIRGGRAWSALWLAPPSGWRLVVSVLLVLPIATLFLMQARAVARAPAARRAALRPKFAAVEALLPHSRAEHRVFSALSLTAGFCEEFLFRGYLVWLFTPSLGLYGAVAVSVVLFGLGHLYQGAKPGMRSGVVGLVLALLALGTGSLLPGMLLHAVLDLGAGAMGFAVFGDGTDERTPAPAS